MFNKDSLTNNLLYITFAYNYLLYLSYFFQLKLFLIILVYLYKNIILWRDSWPLLSKGFTKQKKVKSPCFRLIYHDSPLEKIVLFVNQKIILIFWNNNLNSNKKEILHYLSTCWITCAVQYITGFVQNWRRSILVFSDRIDSYNNWFTKFNEIHIKVYDKSFCFWRNI